MTVAVDPRARGGRHPDILAWLARLARAPRPYLRPARRWTLWRLGAASVLALLALAAVAWLFDAGAITAARKLPNWLVRFFNFITDFGKSGWLLWPLGVILLAIAAVSPYIARRGALVLASVAVRVMFLFAAIALPGLFTNLVKGLIGRARPFVSGIADPFVFNPFVWRPEYASLPSGHGTTALSVLVAFGVLWPRARFVLWGYAVLICLSRVVITAHHPSDVLASAAVGGIGALLVRHYFAARGLGLRIGPDGAVHPLPGPSWRRIKKVAAR